MSTLSSFYGAGAAGGGGGLEWGFYSADQTTIAGKGYFVDNSSATHTITLHANPVIGDTIAVGDLKGSFGINNLTIARNSMKIQGVEENLVLNLKNQRVTLVYSGSADGWIITELEPNNSQYEYMPYAEMRLQEQYASGVSLGTSIIGTQDRVVNTVLQNDIVGASLSSSQITLPAGTYNFRAYAIGSMNAGGRLILYSITDSANFIMGPSYNAGTAATIDSQFTLAAPKTFKIRQYTNNTVSLGSAMNQGIEIYTDIQITKIGGNYAPRLINTDARLQMVAGLNYTDNVQGFDVTKTAANTLTVGVGACKDSTGLVDLYLTADTAVTIPTAANTLYHLFVCRLLAGTMTVKAYTSEAAAAADGTINAFRWIGYWMTNGSSNCKSGYIKYGELYWGKASENFIFALTAPPAGTSTAVSLGSFLPGASRVVGVMIGAQASITGKTANIGFDGTNCHSVLVGYVTFTGDTDSYCWGTGALVWVPIVGTTIYWGDGTDAVVGNVALLLHSVKLRR